MSDSFDSVSLSLSGEQLLKDAGEYLFEKVRETLVELLSLSGSSFLKFSGKSSKSLHHDVILSFCFLYIFLYIFLIFFH